MRRILLIDDNSKLQRESYGASFVDEDEFASILNHIEHVNGDIDVSILDAYDCVLIHDSLEDFQNGAFDEYSHKAKDIIIEYLDKCRIPYVCFSDGHESTGVYDSCNNLVSIKKSDFYSRLRHFLTQYLKEGQIQFHILAYGMNYRKVLMTRLVKALFQKFDSKRPSELISISDVKPSFKDETHYLEEIVALSQPQIGMGYDDILDYIEDENITVREFRSRINNILISVSKYGENTYTWE